MLRHHVVDWGISLPLHGGHLTPAIILHIPVSFFSPEQQQVSDQSPMHKENTVFMLKVRFYPLFFFFFRKFGAFSCL